jgi:hypothetical protein
MLRGRNRGGGGFDHGLELFARDIRIHPVAVGFLFLIEPRLEAFPVEIARHEPVEETQQAPRDVMVNLEAVGSHQAALRPARTSARRCFASHTNAAKMCLQGSFRRRQSAQLQRPSPASDNR